MTQRRERTTVVDADHRFELDLGPGDDRHGWRDPIRVAGRDLRPTPVFDTYWRFAAARHAVYVARVAGQPGPWTTDPVLRRHRFTNCYRAADRVSQFLISQVCYQGDQSPDELFFRVLLFKLFNRVSTWQLLCDSLGGLAWSDYAFDKYDSLLGDAFTRGRRLYSAAYVMPAPRLGEERKHSNHLRLIELMMESHVAEKVQDSSTMSEAFDILRAFPGLGDFLAYQYLIDLNYSILTDFDEMEFVVPGPGARDGIRKCFGAAANGIESDVIRYMTDTQEEHFARLGLTFSGLWGRPLQLVDCQNLFCEVDKYARVAHPSIMGISGRTRIKQSYKPDGHAVPAWFPPKWGLHTPTDSIPSLDDAPAPFFGQASEDQTEASRPAKQLLLS